MTSISKQILINKIGTVLLLILVSFSAKSQFLKETFDKSKDLIGDGLTEVYFVGSGDVQLALSQGKDLAASTGFGGLLWRIWKNNTELQLDAKINVATTVDTITGQSKAGTVDNTRSFGNFVLTPLTTGQATAIQALFYFEDATLKLKDKKWPIKWLHFVDGLHISAVASNQIWRLNYITTNPTTGLDETASMTARHVATIAWRIGFFHEFVPEDLRRKKGYSFRIGMNHIGRSIQGDAGRKVSESFRKDILSSVKKTFWGGEVLLSLRFRNLRAEASLPMLIPKKAIESIPGLSGVQFITSINFIGGFPLPIN